MFLGIEDKLFASAMPESISSSRLRFVLATYIYSQEPILLKLTILKAINGEFNYFRNVAIHQFVAVINVESGRS